MILCTYLDHIINAELEQKFDPSENLITTNYVSDTYVEETYVTHKIPMNPGATIHNIEDSARFAFHLVLSDKKEAAKKAIKVINAIIPLQNMDMEDPNYGNFPTYKEGITNYYTDTTRNIARYFLGIVQLKSRYLEKSLIDKIENSLHAAFFCSLNNEKNVRYDGSIHQLYYIDAYFDYGHYYKLDEYTNVAFNMLNTYYNTIKFSGSFWEYNSKYDIYNTVILLSHIKKYIEKDKNDDILKELLNILWKSVANNYHSSMNILTGAYANSAENIPDDFFYDFLNGCLGLRKKAAPHPESVDIIKCPVRYQLIANSPDPNRFIREEVSKGSNSNFFTLAHIASNYLRPEYSIGTFNREEMGRLHSPFNGYIKSNDSRDLYNFRIHVLNNGNTFSSAEFHSIQQNGFVLAHIFLNKNRGNLHQSIDITNGEITTSDFRIRFEISGNIENLDININDHTLSVTHNSVKLIYDISYIKFGDIPVYFKATKHDKKFCFDAILDIPKDYRFKFADLEKAILQITFLISSSDRKIPGVKNTFENGFLISETEYDNCNLRLESPQNSRNFEFANTYSKEFINGITLTHYILLNKQKSTQYKYITNYDINIFPANETDKFSDDIDKLAKINIKKMSSIAKKILNTMLENNYNVNIFKRYSIQIISVVFERFESENIQQLNKNINISFSNIYQKISISNDNRRTAQLVIETINELESRFISINKKIKESSTVQKVIAIIEEKYLDPDLSLSMIAEMLDMNPSFISREFKNKTNTNYIEYLTNKRIEAAKDMLMQGIPINDVIKKCGNQDISSFKRTFKQRTGMTMSAWISRNS